MIERRLRDRWSAALVLAVAFAAMGGERLCPATFGTKRDSLGFLWDVNNQGIVNDGTSDCFDGGLVLTVNGSRFSARSPMMTVDGREFVLEGTAPGVRVTRRVLVDKARGAARYIEVFENAGKKDVQLTVVIHSTLGGNCQQALTSTGAAFSGALGKKDLGILTVGQGNRPCVMFLVAGRGKVNRPAVSNRNNRTFQFTYKIKLKARRKASLVHVVAQRRGVTAANAADTFAAFYRNGLLKPGIPTRLRRTVVNFLGWPVAEESRPLLEAVLEMAERLDVKRGEADVLILDDEARLSGEVLCGGLKLDTPHGKLDVELSEVALLVGGAGVGRPTRVHLRNGEILYGAIEADGMKLKTESGIELELAPGRIDMLFTRADPKDGKASPRAGAFLETRLGERLALWEHQPAALCAATAWGSLRVRLSEVERLSHVREPRPVHRLTLKDGSRLSVILYGDTLMLDAVRLGPVEIEPQAIARFTRIKTKPSGAETEALPPEVRRLLRERVTFEFAETPFRDALAFLRTVTKTNIILAPGVTGHEKRSVTLKVSNAELKGALEKLFGGLDLDMCWMDGAILIKRAGGKSSPAGSPETSARRLGSAPPEWPPDVRRQLERKVTFAFVKKPLSQAVSFLRGFTKLKLTLAPEVTARGDPRIDLKATKMRMELALRWIARLADCDLRLKDGGIVLTLGSKTPADGDEGGPEDLKAAHCLLAGENLLVGGLDLPEIRVVTAAGVTSLEPRLVLQMERREGADGARPVFAFKLRSGDTLTGCFEERMLPAWCNGAVLRVPVEHVLSARFAAPEEEGAP